MDFQGFWPKNADEFNIAKRTLKQSYKFAGMPVILHPEYHLTKGKAACFTDCPLWQMHAKTGNGHRKKA